MLKLTRRQLIGRAVTVAAGLAGGGMLAACQQQPAPASQPEETQASEVLATQAPQVQEPVNLRLSVWCDVQDKAVYDNITKAFNDQQAGIQVTGEQYCATVGGDNGYYGKIIANFAANTSADVLYWQPWMWQAYMDKFTPLDEYISRDAVQSFFSDDIECVKLGTMWQDKHYLTSVDTGSTVMFYNKDLLDEAGVPYPTGDWTFEEFKELIPKLTWTKEGKKIYGVGQQPWGPGGMSYFDALHYIRMNGKLEFDQIIEPKKVQFNQPEIVDALQFIICDVRAKGYTPDDSAMQGGGVTIATGEIVLCPQGPWFLPQMWGPLAKSEKGINYDVCLMPKGSTGRNEAFGGPEGHSLVNTTKHPDEAWEFMKFVMGDTGQELIAQGGRMPGRRETISKFWSPLVTDLYHFENADVFITGFEQGRFMVAGPQGDDDNTLAGASTPITSAFEAMNGLMKSAKDALAEADAKTQPIIDAYWAKKGS